MDDLIRRNDAIKAFEKRIVEDTIIYQKKIPNTEEVSLLASEIFTGIPAVEPCKDAVSREEVLNAIITADNIGCDLVTLHEVIENLPSVTVEPKQGEWIEREVIDPIGKIMPMEQWQSARCSICGKYHTTPYTYYFDEFKFCPNCGAKMKGADDDSQIDSED